MMKFLIDDIDLEAMSTNDLHVLAAELKELRGAVLKEASRWEDIRCEVCGKEDIGYRGEPFITWEIHAGYPLCPKCSFRFRNRFSEVLPVSATEEVLALLD